MNPLMWSLSLVVEKASRSSAVGSAPRSGRGGRAFESPLLDIKAIFGEPENRFLFFINRQVEDM